MRVVGEFFSLNFLQDASLMFRYRDMAFLFLNTKRADYKNSRGKNLSSIF